MTELRLSGVHHSARPTWKLRETVEFYRDVLGLPLVHSVSARGWGPSNHPDFVHFFFDSGNGSTIAFFYYLGTDQPERLKHLPEYDNDAIHTAWKVDSRETLQAWRQRLESRGVNILYQIEHEVIESIYFRDPNGYYLEITCPLRPFVALDAADAGLTLEAAMTIEDQRRLRQCPETIAQVWRAKGEAMQQPGEGAAVAVYVPDIPEFSAVVEAARAIEGCRVQSPVDGYWCLESDSRLQFERKPMQLGPALWNSLLNGGFRGRILEFGRDRLLIGADA